MENAYRNMIVPDAFVALARDISSTLAPIGGAGMYTTGLSANGQPPATYWVSSGFIDADYAALMPLSEWTWIIDDEETGAGHWEETVISAGEPAVIYAMYAQAIDPTIPAFDEQDVADMLAACDVTTEDPFVAFNRLGLQMVQEEPITE
jgi:hypothetical protein